MIPLCFYYFYYIVVCVGAIVGLPFIPVSLFTTILSSNNRLKIYISNERHNSREKKRERNIE